MSATGYIQVNAYTSFARLPLEDVAIAVTATDGTAIALRITNSSGQIEPIAIPVPDLQESQSPNPPEQPYATVNLYAHLKGFERIEGENVQVFAGVTTVQDLMMIPLSELPYYWDQSEVFDNPPQNL